MVRKTKAEAEQTRQHIIEAARKVFHANGVSRSTLEQIAAEAGVTRGAVYWHFQNKTELFFAMRAQVTLPLIDRLDDLMLGETAENPLSGIEAALNEFLTSLESDELTREVFRIISLRCEYVGDFACVLADTNASHNSFTDKLVIAYQRAADKGQLRPGLSPLDAARDTSTFAAGLCHRWLAECRPGPIAAHARDMIRSHMALRRATPAS